MTAPSPESIKESVEKSAGFVDWLVEVLRGKNPVRKLLLIDGLLIAAFNPLYPALLQRITGRALPWYDWVFWPTVGLVFIIAVIVAMRIKKKQEHEGKWEERSAIRCLLPFGFADAELFRRLQREENIRECLPALTDSQFRFGILCGESGCGKTSFLQAGLWPRLAASDHRCLYVKFTDLDPLDSIRMAIVEQFKLPREVIRGMDLFALMEAVLQPDFQPVIMLFDQFEQFFAHRKLAKQRRPFVQALAEWHRKQPSLPVKILICIREDFTGKLIELQKAMGYSLGPQQNFRLEKFEPEKAAKIFQVMAETAKVSFDENFVNEITQQELASRDDGLISPVDIQILAWMVAGQKSLEERAFNRTSFQKLGGIEGLLERYLTRVLEARETKDRQEAARKILLALTDLDGNTRAGELTLGGLKEKLAGTVSTAQLREELAWLTRADVRLVNSVDDNYELAHERLIPALRRVADKELSIADKANQLLNRRVNEWLGNNRGARYLLAWGEWRLIERQRPYLAWEPQRTHKELFLSRSRRRWWIRLASIITPLLVTSLSGVGYVVWLNSEAGQLYQIKNDLLKLSKEFTDQETLRQVVSSFVISDMSDQAFQVAEGITNPSNKDYILRAIAETKMKMAVASQSDNLFEQARQVTDRMNDPLHKAYVLQYMAEGWAGIDANRSAELFEKARENATAVDSADFKAHLLEVIAGSMTRGAAMNRSPDLLERAAQIVEEIDVDSHKAVAQSYLAEGWARIDANRSAEFFEKSEENLTKASDPDSNPNPSSNPWPAIVGARARAAVAGQSPESLARVIEIAMRVDHFAAWKALYEAMAKIDSNPEEFFARARDVAVGVDNPADRARALTAIVQSWVKVATVRQSLDSLDQAERVAKAITDPLYKAAAFSAIAGVKASAAAAGSSEGVSKAALDLLEQANSFIDQAERLFDQAKKATKAAGNPAGKDAALSAIAGAKAEVAVASQSLKLLDQAQRSFDQAKQTSEQIADPFYKANALSAIAEAIAEAAVASQSLGFLDQAQESEEAITDPFHKAVVLSTVARVKTQVAIATHSPELFDQIKELLDRAKEGAEVMNDPFHRAVALSAIAEAMAQAYPDQSTDDGSKELRELLDRAEQISQRASNPLHEAYAVSAVARAWARIDSNASERFLEYAEKIASKPDNPDVKTFPEEANTKAQALETIVRALAKVAATKESPGLLDRARQIASEIKIDLHKVIALSAIAESWAKIDANKSVVIFNQALEIANRPDNTSAAPAGFVPVFASKAFPFKAPALSSIATAMARAAWASRSPDLLRRATQIADEIDIPFYKAPALSENAKTAVKLRSLRLAREMASKNQDVVFTARALSLMLKTWAELNKTILEDENEEWAPELSM